MGVDGDGDGEQDVRVPVLQPVRRDVRLRDALLPVIYSECCSNVISHNPISLNSI